MELNIYNSYKEKSEDIMIDNLLYNHFLKQHFILFDIEMENRRNDFFDAFAKTNWIKYNAELHKYEDSFQYVYIYGTKFDKVGLYELFYNFNGKTIIFDNDSIFDKQVLINILEGAICSSPDSSSKWPIRLDGKKEFIFKGTVIILTNLDKEKFMKTKKFNYLTRDMYKI
jgi:hypothetical protein